jgi:hypothetical protein
VQSCGVVELNDESGGHPTKVLPAVRVAIWRRQAGRRQIG